jgi:hypothetical protein
MINWNTVSCFISISRWTMSFLLAVITTYGVEVGGGGAAGGPSYLELFHPLTDSNLQPSQTNQYYHIYPWPKPKVTVISEPIYFTIMNKGKITDARITEISPFRFRCLRQYCDGLCLPSSLCQRPSHTGTTAIQGTTEWKNEETNKQRTK